MFWVCGGPENTHTHVHTHTLHVFSYMELMSAAILCHFPLSLATLAAFFVTDNRLMVAKSFFTICIQRKGGCPWGLFTSDTPRATSICVQSHSQTCTQVTGCATNTSCSPIVLCAHSLPYLVNVQPVVTFLQLLDYVIGCVGCCDVYWSSKCLRKTAALVVLSLRAFHDYLICHLHSSQC